MGLVTQRLHITPNAFGILDGRDPTGQIGDGGGGTTITILSWAPVGNYLQNLQGTPFSVSIAVYLTSNVGDPIDFSLVGGTWPSGWSISSDGTISYDGTAVGSANVTIRATQNGVSADSNVFTVESIAVANADALAPTVPTGLSLVTKTASTIAVTCDPPADISASDATPYTGMSQTRFFKDGVLDGVSSMSAGLSLRLSKADISDGSQGGRKLAVGHYTMIPVGHLGADGSLPNNTHVWDTGPVTSDTVAVCVRIHWNLLEPTTKGTYTFGKITKALADVTSLSAIANALPGNPQKKILLFVMVEVKTFDGTDPSPTYLSAFTSTGTDNNGFTVYQMWRWNATVKAGYQGLCKAIGDAFDSNPYFGGIATQETSLGGTNVVGANANYLVNDYVQALKDEGTYIATGCPTSRHLCYINQVKGASSLQIDQILAVLQPLGAIVGNPDLVNTGGLTTSLYPHFTKYHNGTGGIPAPGPTFSSLQNSEWSANGTPAGQAYMTDLFNYATASFTYKAVDNGTDHTSSPLKLDILVWDWHTSVEAGNHNQAFNPSATRIIHDHPSFGTFVPTGSFVAGTLAQSNADYTIAGVGGGIGSTADEWTAGQASITGDATIVAKFISVTGTTVASAFAGLSFRDGTAANSKSVHLHLNSAGVGSYYRSLAGSTATSVATVTSPTISSSVYLKIARSGNQFDFYYSTTGLAWTAVGSFTIALSSALFAEVYAGSGVTTSVTATFQQVAIQNLANPTYTYTGLSASTAYSLTAVARDGAGNDSAASPALSVTTSGAAIHAYSLRSVGTAASGTTALSPGMPAGWQAGDLLLLYVDCRDRTQTLVTPTGWTLLSPEVNVTWNHLYGRVAVFGDTAPSIDYSATPHCRAQIAAFTGSVYTDLSTIVNASVDKNATSTSIVYATVTPSLANCLIIALGSHNKTVASDGAVVGSLSTFATLGTDNDTGTGMSSYWGYLQQTTAIAAPALTQTISGTAESLQYTSAYIALRTS